jgi:ribosomal protein L33
MARSPKGLGPEKGYLARASSYCKRQTRPLVREGALEKQDRNCQIVINIWSTPRLTDWLTVSRNVTLTSTSCGGGVEYLHRNPASRRGRRKGSLQLETAKYCHESQWTRTREWLRRGEPAAIVNDRSSSSQGERPISTNPQLSDSNKNLVVSPRWVIYSKTDWPTDCRS